MRTLILLLLIGLLTSFPTPSAKAESKGDIIPVPGYCSLAAVNTIADQSKTSVAKANAMLRYQMKTGGCISSIVNGGPFIVKLKELAFTFADVDRDFFQVWRAEVMGIKPPLHGYVMVQVNAI